jgi:NADH-quinone oxidoreductase subunit N
MPPTWNTIALLTPEVLLILAATAIFVAGPFTRSRRWWAVAAMVAYIGAAVLLAGKDYALGLSGPLVIDPLGLSLRGLAIFVGLVFTGMLARLADDDLASEQLGSIMIIATGLMFVAAANDLVLLFVGFELISIPTYVLLFLGRRTRASGEATMKYFFLSILTSALLLYGFAFLYGLGKTTLIAGTPELPGIREALSNQAAANPLAPLTPLALLLIFAGLGFKLTIAPLQFYAPDVYQGTTSVNAGILAVAPKIAGVAGFIRLVVVAMPSAAEFAWQLALILAVLTMTIGNVCALWQRNIRRLMAYSSIAHGGYLLIGLAAAAAAVASPEAAYRGGVMAMVFYLIVYILATMGTFAALAFLSSAEHEVNDVDELAGLGKSRPVTAGAVAIFMFSLAGLPPLAGFWGKLTLFGSAIELATSAPAGLASWFTALAIAGALNAAVAAAYYLRIIAVMYFQPSARPVAAAGGASAWLAAIACAALVIGMGALPGRILEMAAQSEAAFRPQVQTVQSAPAVGAALASRSATASDE